MESNEIYKKMADLWVEFSTEHAKSSKAAHGRARKALGEIKKLTKEYGPASMAEEKK